MNDSFDDQNGFGGDLNIELDLDPADVKREQEAKPAMPVPAPPVAPDMVLPTPEAAPVVEPTPPSPPNASSPATQKPYIPSDRPSTGASNLKVAVVLGVLGAIIAVNVYLIYWDSWFPPDAKEVIARLSEDEEGVLIFEGKPHTANWEFEAEIGGFVNQLGRVPFEHAEFMTHQLVLVTGEYADPKKVEITDMDDGVVTWKADTRPKGTIELIYIIPANTAALAEMKKLQPGQWVYIQGDLLDGTLVTPEKVVIKALGEGKIMRLRTVSLEPPPEDEQP